MKYAISLMFFRISARKHNLNQVYDKTNLLNVCIMLVKSYLMGLAILVKGKKLKAKKPGKVMEQKSKEKSQGK